MLVQYGDGIVHPLFGVFLNFVPCLGGLMKSVSLCTCLVMPIGSVQVDSVLSMISLWCIA